MAYELNENPFFVLGCPVESTRAEIERTGQKLLGLLAVGASSARTYESPSGPRTRTEDLVRTALAELRDPEKRIVHELWARAGTAPVSAESQASTRAALVLDLLGWRAPKSSI